jgi:hypothetical protein
MVLGDRARKRVTRLTAYKNLMRRDAEEMAARMTELLNAEQELSLGLGKPARFSHMELLFFTLPNGEEFTLLTRR